jgi:lipopolysaccharide/colanic/teichoic acid biosynthesis glycosyltransferase
MRYLSKIFHILLQRGHGDWIHRAQDFYHSGHVHDKLSLYLIMNIYWRENYEKKYIFNATKRLFDIFFASIALVLLFPLFLVIALVIRLEFRGPACFTQIRPGQYGRPFRILKFRTMRFGSSAIGILPLEKLANDPRVTPFGKFLRKHKIDELPQLINILHGDMSFVGPRPLSLEDTITTDERFWDRFIVPPGATGLWQAMIPDSNNAELKLKADALYSNIRSWKLDLRIILKTMPLLLHGVIERPWSQLKSSKEKTSDDETINRAA